LAHGIKPWEFRSPGEKKGMKDAGKFSLGDA
jgi:hypothetical protein